VILVFGGTGQLGQELVRMGTSQHIAVAGLSRANADIVHYSAVVDALRAYRPSLVVNAAAYTDVDGAESNRTAAVQANAHGPGMLAQACAEAGTPMLHISTDYVFAGDMSSAYVESHPINPVNAYGCTKAAGEAAVQRVHRRHVILRT